MTSDHHSSTSRKYCCPSDEDAENEKLWSDFENCAHMVTNLYNEACWRTLQAAAASTTQLYKTSLEANRKGFDKGFVAGRTSLSKEMLAMLSSLSGKVDLNSMKPLLELLYRNIGLRSDDGQHRGHQYSSTNTLEAVNLFQEALQPSVTSSPQRATDLNNFLANQVQRHRKRQRSPPSPTSAIAKRLKRC